MTEVDNFFLFENESASGLVRIHGLFGELEVTTHQLDNKAHMHDQLVIIPGETSELHSDSRRHMSLVAGGNLHFQGKRCGLGSFDTNLTHGPKDRKSVV